jgi:hypothetical protein
MTTPRGSRKKRIWAYILYFIAFIFATAFIDGGDDWESSLFSAVVAAGVATLLLRSAWQEEEKVAQVTAG